MARAGGRTESPGRWGGTLRRASRRAVLGLAGALPALAVAPAPAASRFGPGRRGRCIRGAEQPLAKARQGVALTYIYDHTDLPQTVGPGTAGWRGASRTSSPAPRPRCSW